MASKHLKVKKCKCRRRNYSLAPDKCFEVTIERYDKNNKSKKDIHHVGCTCLVEKLQKVKGDMITVRTINIKTEVDCGK